MSFLIKILVLKLTFNMIYSSGDIGCRNEFGKPVDWFSVYKLPKTGKNSNSYIQKGTAYAFITEEHQSWSLANTSLGDAKSIAGHTLNILYNQKNITSQDRFGYVLYNDQVGSDENNEHMKTNSRKAHAKGVLIFDKKIALWLIHSIPNYPPKPVTLKYNLADSQTVYAQSMLCLSVPFEQLDQIGLQLFYSYPQIYDSFIPKSLLNLNKKTGELKNLLSALNGERVKKAPFYNVEKLSTLKNNSFLAFHKDAKFDQDLYANLIASFIKSSLFSETWSHGFGTLATDCNTTYPVYNIEKISMNKIVPRFTFNVGNDHSKWAINLAMNANQSKYICIGDINRQKSQKKRGGGSVCFMNNVNVWNSYFDLIELTENCENKNVAPNNIKP